MQSLASVNSFGVVSKCTCSHRHLFLKPRRQGISSIRCTPPTSGQKNQEWWSEMAGPLNKGGCALLASYFMVAGEALAKGKEFGLLEGRSLALVHPAVMITLFGLSCYTGYLGWQWRSLREIGADIKRMKSELPAAGEDGTRPASPLDDDIAELEAMRKNLVSANLRERHYNFGNILLGGGVSIAVFGCLNTYLRTGKLFPGPHLFAGAGIVVLWALAASLVPSMQKGNDSARIAHIGFNTLNVILFAWQLPTGFEIVGKVFEFTTWP